MCLLISGVLMYSPSSGVPKESKGWLAGLPWCLLHFLKVFIVRKEPQTF